MKRLKPLLLILTSLMSISGRSQGLWEKMYNSSVVNTYAPGHHKVIADWNPQHGGLIAYVTDTNGAATNQRCFFVRLNQNGDTIWTKSTIFNKNHDWRNTEDIKSLCRLSNGDYMIGARCDTLGLYYLHLMRIDSMGNRRMLKVDLLNNHSPQDIRVVSGPGGGYYVLSMNFPYTVYTNYSIVQSRTLLERYDSNNVLVARDSFMREDYQFYNPCTYGTSNIVSAFPWTLSLLPAKDGGIYWVFQQDSSAVFSPAICGMKPTGARPGTFVHKYDSAFHLQWRTELTTALHLKTDSLFGGTYAFGTADSGIVVAGRALDTPGIQNNAPMGTLGPVMLVRINKTGQITDSLRAPSSEQFWASTETSNGNILTATRSNNKIFTLPVDGLALLDKHFALLRYTPNPFQYLRFNYFDAFYPNQYGGAFFPYFQDTSAGYYNWVNPIPSAINFDSLLFHYPGLASGKAIRDRNLNCSYEPGIDRPTAIRLIEVINTAPKSLPYMAFTDANGDWERPLPYGNYTVKHAIARNSLAECPGPNAVSAINLNPIAPTALISFYDTVKSNYRDMKVLLNSDPFVQGRTKQLYVFAINNGSVAASDTLRITKPSILNYISANPSPYSVSGNTIIWVLNNIAPDSIAVMTIKLATPALTGNGTRIDFSARYANLLDSNIIDNEDSLHTTVVGPYDPNCKSINRPTYTTAQKDWVYTIEFQNTGNYPAQDVVITDKLDSLLDPGTIRLLKSSHRMPTMEWQDGNGLLFRFHNIFLQDSVHNEPASHGFVTFAIKPVNTIKPGDQISNAAAIYFDFNSPILTNSTFNIIDEPTAVAAVTVNPEFFSVSPNPANYGITLQSKAAGKGMLLDIQGRVLLQFSIPEGKSNILLPAGIAPGIYVLRAWSNTGANIGVQRLMVSK